MLRRASAEGLLTLGLSASTACAALLMSQWLQPPETPVLGYVLSRSAPLIVVLALRPVVAVRFARGRSTMAVQSAVLVAEIAVVLFGPAPFEPAARAP